MRYSDEMEIKIFEQNNNTMSGKQQLENATGIISFLQMNMVMAS